MEENMMENPGAPPPPNPFPKLNIPLDRTTRKRAYQMDFDNMTEADWTRMIEITERKEKLNNALSSPDMLAFVKPKEGPCTELLTDIHKHWDDYWYPEVFHPECGDKDPSDCERAVRCLMQLVLIYHKKGTEKQCRGAYDTYMRVRECLGKIIDEGLFMASQDIKDRFDRYPHKYPGVHASGCSCSH
jgi:hypothetical protein